MVPVFVDPTVATVRAMANERVVRFRAEYAEASHTEHKWYQAFLGVFRQCLLNDISAKRIVVLSICWQSPELHSQDDRRLPEILSATLAHSTGDHSDLLADAVCLCAPVHDHSRCTACSQLLRYDDLRGLDSSAIDPSHDSGASSGIAVDSPVDL